METLPVIIRLALIFFKIGLLTFGGGYAMLPLIQDELVHSGLMSREVFVNILGVAETTPGPMSINTATYVGYEQAGVLGAVTTSLAVAAPSLTAIILLASAFRRLRKSPIGETIFATLRPAIAGLIVSATVSIGFTGLWTDTSLTMFERITSFPNIFAVLIAAGVYFFSSRTKVHPAALIFGSAICGIIFF